MLPRKVGLTFRNPAKMPPYEDALRLVGLDPVAITPENPRGLDDLAGLVITGGTDIDPALYGEAKTDDTEDPDTARDALEAGLLRQALDADLPVLGICRGIQLLNVVRGGALIQHLGDDSPHRTTSVDAHPVRVAPGTHLAAIIRAGDYCVNSRHHQAADSQRIGAGLVVAALAPDGIIEGLELPGMRFVVGVQWHPEDRARSHDKDRRLFEAFARACDDTAR